jgi:hypothetical protein
MEAPTGSPGRVKLLFDVHHSRLAAQRLRQEGHDVLAAAGTPPLEGLPDDDLLRQAAADDRALVTENVKDFDRIVRAWVATGEHHAGVIFTSPRRFHRGSVNYPENLILSLTRILTTPPVAGQDWVHWLQ